MTRLAFVIGSMVFVGCAAHRPTGLSQACDHVRPTDSHVLVTDVGSSRTATTEVVGFFVEVRTGCWHGEFRVGPSSLPFAEVRGPSGCRPLPVEPDNGFFRATGVTRLDTLVFGLSGVEGHTGYVISVKEAVDTYARNRQARARAR